MDDTLSQLELVKERLKSMSAADLSILAALPESLKEQETVRLVTIRGSNNDVLWAQMVPLGWMQLDQPLEEYPASSMYTVLPYAREPLEALLLDLKRDEMPEIFNELRREIPQQIAPRVIAAGGTPSDVAMMLAGIVEGTMRRWIQPELYDEFLQTVIDRARDLTKEL
jgi:hypothetical protein